jgi:hypothetical protein
MPGYDRNSEWERRMHELRTNQGLVGKSIHSPHVFAVMLKRYYKPVAGYLTYFLLRHKLAPDEKAAGDAAELIWEELKRSLPERLAGEWAQGKKSFRDLLREGVHLACHSWSKPATHALLLSGADDDNAWKDQIRRDLLDKALERLKAFQREHEGKGNLYYVIVRLWEENREDSLEGLNARLAALPGGRRLDPRAFRKAFGRARGKFLTYLYEEVAAWIVERDLVGPEELLRAFEELDLLDDYALKSKYCRWQLGLEDEE